MHINAWYKASEKKPKKHQIVLFITDCLNIGYYLSSEYSNSWYTIDDPEFQPMVCYSDKSVKCWCPITLPPREMYIETLENRDKHILEGNGYIYFEPIDVMAHHNHIEDNCIQRRDQV